MPLTLTSLPYEAEVGDQAAARSRLGVRDEKHSTLALERHVYRPRRPPVLSGSFVVTRCSEALPAAGNDEKIAALFPHMHRKPLVRIGFHSGPQPVPVGRPLRVGVLFSGGPASGGHNVLTGLYEYLATRNVSSSLLGFLGGPSGLLDDKHIEIDEMLLFKHRNQGGFHLLGSGRTKIETAEQLEVAFRNCEKLELDGLVIVGGDDSNTNACLLGEYIAEHRGRTCVVGVPKTIDGDLRNEYIEASFGFDTACKVPYLSADGPLRLAHHAGGGTADAPERGHHQRGGGGEAPDAAHDCEHHRRYHRGVHAGHPGAHCRAERGNAVAVAAGAVRGAAVPRPRPARQRAGEQDRVGAPHRRAGGSRTAAAQARAHLLWHVLHGDPLFRLRGSMRPAVQLRLQLLLHAGARGRRPDRARLHRIHGAGHRPMSRARAMGGGRRAANVDDEYRAPQGQGCAGDRKVDRESGRRGLSVLQICAARLEAVGRLPRGGPDAVLRAARRRDHPHHRDDRVRRSSGVLRILAYFQGGFCRRRVVGSAACVARLSSANTHPSMRVAK
eukprot:ctg_561.g204